MPKAKPKRRKTKGALSAVPGVAPGAELDEVPSEAMPDTDGTIFDRELLVADAYVRVRKRDPRRQTFTYISRLSPQDATEETLSEYWGGGDYRCELLAKNDQGNYVIVRQRTFSVGGDPKPVSRFPASSERATVQGGTTPQTLSGVPVNGERRVSVDDVLTGGLLNLFNTMSAAQQTQVEALRQITNRPTMDWAAVIAAAAPVIVKLVERSNVKEDVDILAIIERVTTLVKEKAGTSPTAMVKEQLELMNEYLDFKDRNAPDDDPLYTLARDNLPKFLSIIQGEQKRRGQMPTPDELRAAARQALPPAAQTLAAGSGAQAAALPMWKQLLHTQRRMLVGQAMRDKDPALAADWVAENLPDVFLGSVRWLFNQENVMELVLVEVPELGEYPQWTERFFARLAENVLGEEREPEPEEEPS